MDALSSIRRIAASALAVFAALAIAACDDAPPSDTVAKGAATFTPAPTSAPPTFTPTPTPSPTPAPTFTPTSTPAPTSSPTSAPPTFTPTPTPTLTPNPAPTLGDLALDSLGELSRVALGERHACGLRRADGRAVCVGSVSDEADRSAAFSDISSGRDYACGLRTDGGAVSCWESAAYGDGSGVDAPEGSFAALSAGGRHACALRADGAAVCWGHNAHGRATPPPGERFSAIAAGVAHTCGIAEFGNLICWGRSDSGQSAPREGPFFALALGANHTCALRSGGSAFCQGNDSHGQSTPPPTAFAQIAAGGRQSCGITPDGGLECWGIMPISSDAEKFASVSVGRGRTCALTVDGALRCWRAPQPKDPTNGAWLVGPIEMFPWPLGGVAVAERRGHIQIYPPEGGEPRTALDLTAQTRCCDFDRGMLSAALDPDFDRFPFIYVYWQRKSDDDPDAFEGRVSRFPVTPDGDALEDEELVMFSFPQTDWTNFGGAIRFGADGMMYLGLGQLAETHEMTDEDWLHPSVNFSMLAGKIIRIDVRGATAERPYRAPPDNPFVGAPGARPEIWAYGLRNPWRMSFAPNGDLLVGDVGAESIEELSIATRGANLGWPMFEGSRCRAQDARDCEDAEGYTFPIHEYTHEDGRCAIIGGVTAPDGKYVFGDHCTGRVWAAERTAPDVWSVNEIMELPSPLTAFGSDAGGNVYALTIFGVAARVGE